MSRSSDGTIRLHHASSAFYVSGFDSKNAAAMWLLTYLLALEEQQEKSRLERDRVLAEMLWAGKVS